MARSAAGFMFDISFMTDEDKNEVIKELCECDSDCLEPQQIVNNEKTSIYADDTGISYGTYQDLPKVYIRFVLKHYPSIATEGYIDFDWLSSEGNFKTIFAIGQGTCHIKEVNAPMDLPSWCPECDEQLDSIDLSELTADNYWDAELVCPECGKIINLRDEYDIEILEYDWDEE